MKRFALAAVVALSSCATEKVAVNEIAPPELIIETLPRGAKLSEAQQELGATPYVVKVINRAGTRTFTVQRDGFLPQQVMVKLEDVPPNGGQMLVPLRPATWAKSVKPIDPDNAQQLAAAGVELVKSEKCPEALEFLKRTVTLDPKIAVAHKGLGNCYARMKRTRQAVNAYKQYLLYAPTAPDYDQVAAMIGKAEGDIDIPDDNTEKR